MITTTYIFIFLAGLFLGHVLAGFCYSSLTQRVVDRIELHIDHWKETLELGIALGARGFLFNRYNAGGECHGEPEKLMPSVDQVRAGLFVSEEYCKNSQ